MKKEKPGKLCWRDIEIRGKCLNHTCYYLLADELITPVFRIKKKKQIFAKKMISIPWKALASMVEQRTAGLKWPAPTLQISCSRFSSAVHRVTRPHPVESSALHSQKSAQANNCTALALSNYPLSEPAHTNTFLHLIKYCNSRLSLINEERYSV